MVDSPQSDGFSPEYLEDYSGGRLIAATTTMMAMATVLLGLRIYARRLTNAARGLDDLLLLPAWISLLGLGIVMYISVSVAGVGRHYQAVVVQDLQKPIIFSKLLYPLQWAYVLATTFPRVSVVLLYLRIFQSKLARSLCWAVVVFLVCNSIATIISARLQCIPLAYLWDNTIKGRCFDTSLWYKLLNFPNIAADIAIMFLPAETIWKLQASRARKAGITLVCFFGSVGLIASCIRANIFFELTDKLSSDYSWTDVRLLTWTIVEPGMYFSAACLIGLRPLISKVSVCFKGKLFKKGGSEHSYKASGPTLQLRGMTRQSAKAETSTRSDFDDTDSLFHIVPSNHDVEVGPIQKYDGNDNSTLACPGGSKQIQRLG